MLKTGSGIEKTSDIIKLNPLIFQIRKTEDYRNENDLYNETHRLRKIEHKILPFLTSSQVL